MTALTNGTDAAFARPADVLDDGAPGLTKREYFAAAALQGLLARNNTLANKPSEITEVAVVCADRLIEALNKKGGAE